MKLSSAAPRYTHALTTPIQLSKPPLAIDSAASPAFVPRIPLPPSTPPAEQPNLPVPSPPSNNEACSYDRSLLWERVVSSQFGLRVGSKREKAIALTAVTATLGAVGAIAALATVSSHGVALAAIIGLGASNAVLGCIGTNVAVQTFRHTRPARPGALRRHSFYLTGVVTSRTRARQVTKWLVEHDFVAEGRQRAVLKPARGMDLMRLGLRERVPGLTPTDVEKIADILVMVRSIEQTIATRP